MHRSSIINYIKYLVISLLLVLLGSVVYTLRYYDTEAADHVERFQKALYERETLLENHLADFAGKYADSRGASIQNAGYLERLALLSEEKGIVFVVFDDRGAVFWSDNSVPLDGEYPPEGSVGAVQKQNGWYLYKREKTEDADIVAYAIVKTAYRYQNRFLVNEFHHDLPGITDLFYVSDRIDEGYSLTNRDGEHLFSLGLKREAALKRPAAFVYLLSVLLSVAAMILAVYATFRYFSTLFRTGKRTLAIAGYIGVIVAARMVSFWLNTPSSFYASRLFSPELYATSDILPSLGDLLMNVSLITIIGYFLFYNFRRSSINISLKKPAASVVSFLLFLLIYLICGLSIYLIKGLVINSHLSLDLNFIFNLDYYSIAGFLVIGLIFFAFFFFSIVLCRIANSLIGNTREFRIASIVSFLVLFALTWLIIRPMPVLWTLSVAAVFVFELDRKSSSSERSFSALVLSLFIFSIISTFALHRFNTEKELEKRRTLVLQLASEQDPVAEFLFLEIEDALFNDNQLQNLVLRDPYNEALVYSYIQHHYFYDFWAKYDLQVTICRPYELLLVRPDNIEVECAVFFDDYIARFGKQTISDRFIYLDNDTGRNSYITVIPVGGQDDYNPEALYHVYIEFDSKFIARDMGFPELLIDEEIDINRELLNYSHATYKNGILVNEAGPFIYSVNASAYGEPEGEFTVFQFDGYCHMMYRKDDETLFIISRPEGNFLEAIAPFSYLFITFFILAACFWLLFNRKRPLRLLKMNFKRRVQYSMITILLVSALSIGGASAYFIYSIYENKNLSFLNEKTHSVLLEIERELAEQRFLDPAMEYYLYDLLLHYSNVFFTDINIYSIDGRLLASSRPKVFEEGLVGSRMHPVAFHKVHSEYTSQFIHKENIGKLEFLSAYTPLYNIYNEVIGYLNLPYFAKQSELRSEVSYFFVAFINIYLLLVVLAVVLALLVAGYVTKPLQLIRDNMARVKLGKKNRKISWDRDDEIGNLIKEYNRMIDELAISAELLAKSERESAWREMARQVAHEIKNPLTPMKLSVQYLEKAWKESVPDWEERLERFTKTMVEQIDNMSVIAREFSDFAKMPAGRNDHLDLRTFIPEVLDMYKDFEKVNITLEMPEDDDQLKVLADKNQLLRVFNNLIKNAIQSYGKNQTAEITVSCTRDDGYCNISIADSGCGIPEEKQDNIFTPYFTTKAKGMGLGLSMVKNIIEGFGGSLWFKSEEGRGSIFSFSLPLA